MLIKKYLKKENTMSGPIYVYTGEGVTQDAGGTSGYVGIGTATPNQKLHVEGNLEQNGHIFMYSGKRLYIDGGSDTYLSEVSANTLQIVTNSVERLRVDGEGNVGIATTNPGAAFVTNSCHPGLEVAGHAIISDGSGKESIIIAPPPVGSGDDDRENIQDAINAVAASAGVGGGTVMLQQGTYLVNKDPSNNWAINLKNGVHLIGASMNGTIIKLTSPGGSPYSNMPIITLNDAPNSGYQQAVIKDLKVENDTGNTTGIIGINVCNNSFDHSPQPVLIDSVKVLNCQTGIYMSSWFSEIHNCDIAGCDQYGIYMTYYWSGSEHTQTDKTNIFHTNIWGSAADTLKYGIRVSGKSNQIIGCNIGNIAHDGYGIYLYEDNAECDSNYICGNYIESGTAGAKGIRLYSLGNTVIGNHFDLTSGANCIIYDGDSGNAANGCVVQGNYNYRDRMILDSCIGSKLGIGSPSPSQTLTVKNACFEIVKYYNGSAYTDLTSEAKTTGGTAYTVLSNTLDPDDRFYVGLDRVFQKIYFDIAAAGADVSLAVKYWNGSAWTAVSNLSDGTSNLTQSGLTTFDLSSNWAWHTVDDSNLFWIEISGGSGVTTAPTAYLTIPNNDDRLGVYAQSGDTVPALLVNKVGNTGFGTTSPDDRLDLDGAMRLSGEYAEIASISNLHLVIDSDNSSTTNYFRISKDARSSKGGTPTELFRVQENGAVGIGLTNPDWKLSVQDASNITQAIFGQDRTTDQSQIAIGEQDTSDKSFNIGFDHSNKYGYLQVSGDSIGSALVVANDGNVGVGTTSPTVKLHVDGEIRMKVYTDGTRPSASSVGAGTMIYNSSDNAPNFSDGTNWRDAMGSIT